MKTYQVIVGNVGTVYNGSSKDEAISTYNDYVAASKIGTGSAGGEDVTILANCDNKDTVVIDEHAGHWIAMGEDMED